MCMCVLIIVGSHTHTHTPSVAVWAKASNLRAESDDGEFDPAPTQKVTFGINGNWTLLDL